MKTIFIFVFLILSGCASTADINKTNARLDVLEKRLVSMDKDISDIQAYNERKYNFDKKKYETIIQENDRINSKLTNHDQLIKGHEDTINGWKQGVQ